MGSLLSSEGQCEGTGHLGSGREDTELQKEREKNEEMLKCPNIKDSGLSY